MNSKFVLLLLISFISSCGVKSPPRPPEGSSIDSVVDRLSEEKEEKKNQND